MPLRASNTSAVPPLWSVEDVATWTGLSPKTIYRLVEEGRLPCLRVSPGRIRFDPEQLRRHFAEVAAAAGGAR